MRNMIIQVQNLTKRFGELTAVDDLSFEVRPGEAISLWGANGAGKTTALRCLLHLIPFRGQVLLAGLDVRKEGKAARRQVGFVPQELTFHDDMTVGETLTFYARLKKAPDGYDFTPLLARLELERHIAKPVGDLSGGLKQRLALALALLTDPPILVLDEPTANLDIRAREDFLYLLRELQEGGKTLVFSSHRLEEVTALADRALLLEAGRLTVDAPPHELERRLGRTATLHLYIPGKKIDPALDLLAGEGLPAQRNGRGIRVEVQAKEKLDALRLLQEAGIDVTDFSLE